MANLSKCIDSKSSLWCHSLHSEHTCAGKPKEEAFTIDRIASATAVRTLDFIHLKEGPPFCTIGGRVIPRCELIAIWARPSSAVVPKMRTVHADLYFSIVTPISAHK